MKRSTISRRLARSRHHVIAVSVCGVLLAQAWVLAVQYAEGNGPIPPNFGNFPHVRDMLEPPDPATGAIRFAVVGDIKGTGTFERIAEQLRDEPLNFIALLGDLVHGPEPGEHAYFRAEMSEYGLQCPVFLLVGNHDVGTGEFTLDDFERQYGPTNFHFSYGGNLFLVLRMLEKPADGNVPSLQYAKRVLAIEAAAHQRVFVLTHIPPRVSDHFHARNAPGADELAAMLDEHNIDYLIAGDHHGYARVRHRGTNYVISGGGGAHLRDGKYGRFHHAVVFEVTPDGVSERILKVDRDEDLADRLERAALANVYPFMSDYPGLMVLLNAGLIVWAWGAWFRERRTGRRPARTRAIARPA